jgi:hypothetical protein
MIAIAIIAFMLGGSIGFCLAAVFGINDQWATHDGNKRPFATNPYVAVMLRSGEQLEGPSLMFKWQHNNHPNDVLKYKVLYDT